MDIEKFISYQIESQFPQIYREEGQELIAFVKSYYEFLENQPGMTLYEGRRLFEYKDIDRTLEKMIIFYKNKYLAGVPYNRKNIRFIVKNIMDLYRRRGTAEGVELFFKMFYNQDAYVKYPAKNIFKPSHSQWKVTRYIQMNPSTDITSLGRILGKRILGSVSKAGAVADKINFIIVNGSFTPIIFINEVIGEFVLYDDIFCEVLGEFINFGRIDSTLSSLNMNTLDDRATTGNKVGQVVNIESIYGYGGKGIVTKVNENATGEISYELLDGGFGYTVENTSLLVSDQVIFTANQEVQFTLLEHVEDQFGNRGTITGRTEQVLAVKMDEGDFFTSNSVIVTTDRPSNTNITVDYIFLSEKNSSSPGPLYPEVLTAGGTNTEIETAVTAILDEIETVSLITDVISNFASVPLNSSNFNTIPPASAEMSGNTDPVTLSTVIGDAFNLESFDIGRIIGFNNLFPGSDYTNDVFNVVYDPVMSAFDRPNQNITLEDISSLMSIGDTVSQGSINGIVRGVNGTTVTITPYAYYGFSKDQPLTYRGVDYNIITISGDYNSKRYGENAIMQSTTDFAVGKIQEIRVTNTGFGYKENIEAVLKNDAGTTLGVGSIATAGQGFGDGFWATFDSHANGYNIDESNNAIYFDYTKRIRDNDYYQEYSYEVLSKVDINKYEQPLRDTVHVAGTKVFGKFVFTDTLKTEPNMLVSLVIEE